MVAILTMLGETSTYAQQALPPIFDPTGRSGEPPAPLKKEFKPPTPAPLPTLPVVPVPPEGEVKKPLGQIQVFDSNIHVTGSTVFSDSELAEVTAPYTNRILTTEDLERLRLALTLLYVNKGYITSGATIAHQNVTGNGDAFSFTYGRSRGVNPIVDTSYSLPLNRYDTTFITSYRRNDSLVVAAPFRSLNLNAESEIIGFTLRQPIYRT